MEKPRMRDRVKSVFGWGGHRGLKAGENDAPPQYEWEIVQVVNAGGGGGAQAHPGIAGSMPLPADLSAPMSRMPAAAPDDPRAIFGVNSHKTSFYFSGRDDSPITARAIEVAHEMVQASEGRIMDNDSDGNAGQ